MAAMSVRQGRCGLPFGWTATMIVLMTALPCAARAQIGSDRYSSIVVDAATGTVLQQDNPDAPRHPASLAKLMTLYLVFEALRDRRITADEEVPISAHAAAMEPTKLGLLPGMHITVEEAVLGLITKSANDAAAALGELLGGSEERFAQMMTLRARALGMPLTTFTNASGLPDPDEWTTARDMATLARRLITDFPADYHYFSTPNFVFHRQVIVNHDGMLKSYPGADGMKTGYTEASGHNLVTSAVHGGVRLIGVELGAATNAARDVQMAALLNAGFDQMGVPPMPRPTLIANRAPSLINSAHAATLHEVRAQVPERTEPPLSTWSIQAGGYGSEKIARDAGQQVRRAAGGGQIRIDRITVHGRTLWRTEVVGLTEARAQGACAALAHGRIPCVVARSDARQVASR
jgi:D-alanyl-D-alanine carboxypeptidase